MAEEDRLPSNNEEEQDLPTPEYDNLVIEEPEHVVSLEKFEVQPSESDDGEDDTVSKTDLQAAMKAITPRFKDKRMDAILQPIMVSRIFPDEYIPLRNWVIACLMLENAHKKGLDILAITTGVQVAISKAWDGKHIIDILEIAGVAHDEELDKLSKDLGL